MKPDPVQQAVERSNAAALVLERHKAAIEPHLAMLCACFGPAIFRSIVSGAVEAAVIAWEREHGRTVIPFPGDEG